MKKPTVTLFWASILNNNRNPRAGKLLSTVIKSQKRQRSDKEGYQTNIEYQSKQGIYTNSTWKLDICCAFSQKSRIRLLINLFKSLLQRAYAQILHGIFIFLALSRKSHWLSLNYSLNLLNVLVCPLKLGRKFSPCSSHHLNMLFYITKRLKIKFIMDDYLFI